MWVPSRPTVISLAIIHLTFRADRKPDAPEAEQLRISAASAILQIKKNRIRGTGPVAFPAAVFHAPVRAVKAPVDSILYYNIRLRRWQMINAFRKEGITAFQAARPVVQSLCARRCRKRPEDGKENSADGDLESLARLPEDQSRLRELLCLQTG
jgi:hypothetical protein